MNNERQPQDVPDEANQSIKLFMMSIITKKDNLNIHTHTKKKDFYLPGNH